MTDILVERTGSTTVLVLDNPDALNALTPGMIEGLRQALDAVERDRAVRAVVLTGTGTRAFCVGIDVKSVDERDAAAAGSTGRADGAHPVDPIQEQFENLDRNLGSLIRTIHHLPVPVVAAVNGHAIGAGFALAAASDLRLSSDTASFADGFIRRGISGCELGLSYFLPRLVGASTAFEWMLTGRRIEAAEAERVGLVSQVTGPDELVGAAVELAGQVAVNAPLAVTLTKEVMWANLHAGSLDHALALESRTQIMARTTADAAEARQSFLDRRDPEFGRPGDAPTTTLIGPSG